MKRSKKRWGMFLAGITGIAVVGAAWAYFSNTATIDNKLKTEDGYGSKTIEEFTPNQSVEPGSEITKKISTTNTGAYDLVVRVKMDESWSRQNLDFISFASSSAQFNTVAKVGTVYTATQAGGVPGETDGKTAGDDSVMYKNLDLTNWMAGGDGYWYYKKLLKPGENTGDLLKSLVLATNTDMGKYTAAEYYSTVDKADPTLTAAQAAYQAALTTYQNTPNPVNLAALKQKESDLDVAYHWTTVKPLDESTITFMKNENAIDPVDSGYAKADYKLSITTEVCQATEDAVTATWTVNPLPPLVKAAWGW